MFHTTRLKLTAWYLFIIMCISIIFSSVIYKGISNEIERFEKIQRLRIERRLLEREIPLLPGQISHLPILPPTTNPELLEESKHRVFLLLLMINLGIFTLSGTLGYFLAGKTLRPIQDMVNEQNRFISDASHELRTPLTSLKTSMEVGLRNKSLNLKEATTLISESIIEVNKLQCLSDELLQLTQYQKINGTFQFQKLFLSDIVKEAVQKISPLAKQKQIKISNQIEDCVINGNRFALVDLLVILLDNAIKYSNSKTTIKIYTKTDDKLVSLSVKDEGIGIDKKDIPFIFDRFYRTDIARSKTSIGGYGLGLSIAQKIITYHQGSISIESKLHKGTTFTVLLPKKNKVKKIINFS